MEYNIKEDIQKEYSKKGVLLNIINWKNMYWFKYNKKGYLESEGGINNDGFPHGLWTFFEDNEVYAEGYYFNGEKDSIWRYYPSHSLVWLDETREWVDRDSLCKTCYTELLWEETYQQGKLNGLYREYYSYMDIFPDKIKYDDYDDPSWEEAEKQYEMWDKMPIEEQKIVLLKVEGNYKDGKKLGSWKTFKNKQLIKTKEY